MVARSAEVLQMLLHHPEKNGELGEGGKKKEEDKAVIEEGGRGRGEGGVREGEEGGLINATTAVAAATLEGVEGAGEEQEGRRNEDDGRHEDGEKERRGTAQRWRGRGGSDQGRGREGALGSDEESEGGGERARGGAQAQAFLDVYIQDLDGHTALHCAMFGRLKAQWALPILLAHGANPWIKDNRGKCPVYYLGHSRPFFVENLLKTAMTYPPPRVWSLCKARAAGEVEGLEEGEGERERGEGAREGGSGPSRKRGLKK